MDLIFCGTPEFAVPSLRRLLAEKFSLLAVITQPDRPRGRGQKVSASPVKDVALEAALHVYQPEKIKDESARRFLEKMQPEAIVIIGYGQIIPADLLDRPKYGWINLHASLLPKYRGAAPVNWALIEGETITGVTTMRIDAGLDTGDMLLQRECPITPDDTAVTLACKLSELGAELMVETLRELEAGTITPQPQDHSRATFAPRLKKEDGKIDWTQPATRIANRVRGLQPWPATYTTFRGQLCHIWRARPTPAVPTPDVPAAPGLCVARDHRIFVMCGEQTWLELEELQWENRKRMSARNFLNGLHPALRDAGERFA